jgi:hypothetical protein
MKSKIFLTISLLFCGVLLVSLLAGWRERTVTVPFATISGSAQKGLLLLEKSGYVFTSRARHNCTSCHHSTLTSMAVEIAIQKGIPEVDSFAAGRVRAMESTLQGAANPNLVDQFITVNFIAPYVLLGLAAEKYPPNFYTDMAVDYMMGQAKNDGSFWGESGRAPLESGDIHLAAMAIHAIRLYASPAKQIRVNEMVARTKHWIEQASPDHHQELVFQLLGMQWCGSDREQKTKVAEKLLSMQHADGGWSQLSTLGSDAYATGQSLYALYQSGMLRPEEEAYQKGLRYLLKIQDETGAWIVETRSFPIQPFFSSDFPPYDENQYISATATNWSVMALLQALPDKANQRLTR